eukprot:TRINITY_DN1077_c0_g1_i1.p1 TRINITY_DN1077_c0_g1~~TRINITY_DN1077_c0_g1_i1.p1  ORF type:complete len:714 (-),score=152.03 TRINITY_DN1077_c0_g1_i1:97-2238(-)
MAIFFNPKTAAVAFVVACLVAPLFAVPVSQAIPISVQEAIDQAGLDGDKIAGEFLIGSGIYDITGPAAEVVMMGYAIPSMKTLGINSRLFSRAFIVSDRATGKKVLIVNTDLGVMPNLVKKEVLLQLDQLYPGEFTEENFLLSAQHTHSGPGGYDAFFLYNISIGGFVRDNFLAIVDGITKSISRAVKNIRPGSIKINVGNLYDASGNRAMPAYVNNPESERSQYGFNTDPTMTVLRFDGDDGTALGAITYYAVHGTSMKNYGTLISGDNKGYASYTFEKAMGGSHLKETTFVASFPNSNGGDASPNNNGPDGKISGAHMKGIGRDHYQSCSKNGNMQYEKARQLYDSAREVVAGVVDYRHTRVQMANLSLSAEFGYGQARTLCEAALGYSFAVGAQGEGDPEIPGFTQGQLESIPFWDRLSQIVHGPLSPEIKQCHAPKPILLAVGITKLAGQPRPMTPSILPLQLLRIGQVAIIGFPGEITTMAGRRLRNTVKQYLGDSVSHVILNAYANAFVQYTTTFEEYQIQYYEGASTHFGPYSLAGYQQEYSKLATALRSGSPVASGPDAYEPPIFDNRKTYPADTVPEGKSFGQVEIQPSLIYQRGGIANVTFWGAHPRSNFFTQSSFVTVEKNDGRGTYSPVAHDWDFETHMHWQRVNETASLVTVEWYIPKEQAVGAYRIRYSGTRKDEQGTVIPIPENPAVHGFSRDFQVSR